MGPEDEDAMWLPLSEDYWELEEEAEGDDAVYAVFE
jgi:hypothetical protein